MGLFSRKPVAVGRFQVVGVTRLDGLGTLVLNGVPQQKLHVSGLVLVDGQAPEAAAVDVHLGIGSSPAVGAVLPVEVLHARPLRLRVLWSTTAEEQTVRAAQQDATAQVVADLASGARLTHSAGEVDPLGIALTDPDAPHTIAEQVAAALGTPISVDADIGGANQHLTANGGRHLSSADAAELLRSGTPATATITGATRVPIPQSMLPSPDASLWDLALEVRRADGSTYSATTRVGFRSEARRAVIGAPGSTIPVRIDPVDDGRVAVDSTTFDREHPGAPAA